MPRGAGSLTLTTTLLSVGHDHDFDPLELIEEVAAVHDWPCERHDDGDIALHIVGRSCEYRLWFGWREDMHALHFSCALDSRVPKARWRALYPLLAKINERLWLGHFELWQDERRPAFRHTLLLARPDSLSANLIQALIDAAIEECERFYCAFQFVIWGGKSAEEAIAAAILDPIGEA